MKTEVSVIIITKDVANDIRRCLESVSDFAEIIVVDSGSTDNTVSICREYTDRVYHNEWPGFGKQKNYALSKTTKDWVLSIDADEWLTSDLKKEIIAATKSNENASFNLRRRSYCCGKLIRFGHWRKDKVLRLFRKSSGKFTNDSVHEKLIVNNDVKTLKHYLLHNPFVVLEDIINKMDLYSSLSAKQKFASGKKSSVLFAVVKSLWSFINSYIFKLGFLDGKEGFIVAFSFAEGTFYKYAKLSLLNCSAK